VDDFALVSDTAYVAQNGGRIIRALLEIGISRKWASVTVVLMAMSKAIEKRLWPFDQPLKQFDLKADIFYGLQTHADELTVSELSELSAAELGKLVRLNEQHGAAIRRSAKQFPAARISYNLRPLGNDVLKLVVHISPAFDWNSRIHGSAEPFWLWVEDHDGIAILQLSHLLFRPNSDVLHNEFFISIPNGHLPPSVTIRFVSDRWLGAEDEVHIPFDSLVMPAPSNGRTPLLDLPFLSLSALGNNALQKYFANRIHNFNAIQTQTFWSLIQTAFHALVCAPTGSGKSIMAQMLIWFELLFSLEGYLISLFRMTTLKSTSDSWVLVVAPRRSIAMEMISDLRGFAKLTGVTLDLVSSQNALVKIKGKAVRVVTAPDLLTAMSQWDPKARLAGPDLVVCESLEQLDSAYELGISLLRHVTQTSPTRFVGFSNCLNDPTDLAAWLEVDPYALYSFRPSDRDQALTFNTQTFTIPHSASLFKAMAKPAHAAIQSAGPGESAIVFVSFRGQCRVTATDLITQCSLEMETEKGYLPLDYRKDFLEDCLVRLQDQTLVHFVSRGVGFFHDGIRKPDRNLMLELYVEGIIRVLVVPRECCWTLPVRATVVVVMGTQHFYAETEGSEHQLRDYELAELIRMQGRAVRHSGIGYFNLFCQAEAQDTFTHFLNEGLPMESRLLETRDLELWYKDQRSKGAISDRQQGLEALSFTFLARRIVSNPVYYDASLTSLDENLSRIVDKLETPTGPWT
jgi:antiviral helicase SLH1